MGFANLHVHTGYSLLDGMVRIPELVEKVKGMGQTACAITDHGTLAGAVKFTEACLAEGIKPIVGQEFYIAPDSRLRKKYAKGEHSYSHLILFAKNEVGWKNLIHLSTNAFEEGFYRKPRIDREILARHSEGLICTSACCGGDVSVFLMGASGEENAKVAYDPGQATARLAWYRSVFGEDFYAEMQSYGAAYQESINDFYRRNMPAEQLIATADCHYLNVEDADTHDTLLCFQTYSKKNDPDRWRFVANTFHVKSEAEMLCDFCPHEVENTMRLADKIEFELPLRKQWFMPELPHDVTMGDSVRTFRDLCNSGLKKHIDPCDNTQRFTTYYARLEMEMAVYEKAGYIDYALLLWDLIAWCRANGIFTGDGRGSGVGSLVLYCLGITKVDPIERDCPFERFINAGRLERFSPPDVDLDFPRSRRADVIAYLKERYGPGRVCQIGTYATLGPSAVIRQLGVALGIDAGTVAALTAPIPSGENSVQGGGAAGEVSGLSLEDIYEQIEAFRQTIDGLGKTGEALMYYGSRLAKLGTHASKHASGIIIANQPVADLIPLMRVESGGDALMSQFDMFDAEALGLVKFDILGLKTLDVLDYVETEVRRKEDPEFSFETIDLDDPLPYTLMREGRTVGIFQAEGGGFGQLLPQARPRSVEHLAALTSLCRPGPKNAGLTDAYVRRIRGEEVVNYSIPQLEPILERNYGIITYQEDIMAIAHRLAGYSLAEADDLRKIMGKKQRDKMPKQHDKFVAGLQRFCNAPLAEAEELWTQIEGMAEYVFNRGHAVAYSYLTAKCAYAKSYYPAYFIAGSMTQESLGTAESLPALLSDARYLQVSLKPPNINSSLGSFTATDARTILVGLRGIKGVGEKAVETILAERDKGGPFRSVEDFRKRVPARSCNSGVLQALERSGAFDELEGRQRLMTTERMYEEFELFGFFISGHPFTKARERWTGVSTIAAVFADKSREQYWTYRNKQRLKTWGFKQYAIRAIVTKLDKKRSKKTDKLMFFTEFEDETGGAKVIVHAHHLEKFGGVENLKKGTVLEIVGRRSSELRWTGYIEASSITPLLLKG